MTDYVLGLITGFSIAFVGLFLFAWWQDAHE